MVSDSVDDGLVDRVRFDTVVRAWEVGLWVCMYVWVYAEVEVGTYIPG